MPELLAAERIAVELDSVAGELREATRRVEVFEIEIRPYRITKRLVQELLDQMSGFIEHASLETRVAWVRDLFELVEVDGVEQRAVARWKAPTDQDVGRLAPADRFTSYTGTAPIEVSSGKVTRHRLSRGGNRSLNTALHLAARVQAMHPGAGRDHYDRKLAENKSSREALRSLKRQLAKVVYRHLVADREHDLALAV